MSSERYLWWSHIEAYEECPQKYLWKHGFGVIDLGRGPGKGKPLPEVRMSGHNAMMGNVLSWAIERLYNDELWREPATLVQRLTEIVEKDFALRLSKTYIEWDEDWTENSRVKHDKSPPKEVLLRICLEGILNYLRTMRRNRLLGQYAKSEVELSGYVDKFTKIAGRPDLIIRRDDNGTTIVDGKNSMSPGRHTNADQLRWYALCYFVAYNVIPNRLAFAYFRFPEGVPPKEVGPNKPYEGKPEEWSGLVEVSCDRSDLKTLAHRSVETRKVMLKEYFDPSPSTKACNFCDFKPVCPAHQKWKEENARKPRAPKDALESTLLSSNGFVTFGGDTDPRKT